jgi:hypothetical protein
MALLAVARGSVTSRSGAGGAAVVIRALARLTRQAAREASPLPQRQRERNADEHRIDRGRLWQCHASMSEQPRRKQRRRLLTARRQRLCAQDSKGDRAWL